MNTLTENPRRTPPLPAGRVPGHMPVRTGALARAALAACSGLALLAGCATVPGGNELVSQGKGGFSETQAAPCTALPPRAVGEGAPGSLDPGGFTLLSWNVRKGTAADWPADFLRLAAGRDLVLLQEAHLTDRFLGTLRHSGLNWTMVRAFDYRNAGTGVLTAGRSAPSAACLARHAEPLLGLPKAVLYTTYPLAGRESDLLLVNLHAINFTPGTGRFREQLESAASVIRGHAGPVVLAGDFNDWNARRRGILARITRDLDLDILNLAHDGRSRHFGTAVDHLFHRGLDVAEAASLPVSSSDHHPLLVRFSLAGHFRGDVQ